MFLLMENIGRSDRLSPSSLQSSQIHIQYLFSIAALALGLVSVSPSRMAEGPLASAHAPRGAEKESCNQCKFADCIRNSIKNKEALMQGYKELAGKWGKFWTSTDSGQRVELTEIDWGKMNEASKKSTLEALSDEFKKYKEDVEEMTNRIGPTKACGYEFSSGGLEMETNPLTCNINMPLARKVEEAVPCKELYEIAFKHETMHLQKCQARLSSKKLLTPAGLAFEEAEGYAQEIAELERLLEKIDKDCCKQNSGWSGTITFSHYRKKESHSGPVKSPIHANRITEGKSVDTFDQSGSIKITGLKTDDSDAESVFAILEGTANGRLTAEEVTEGTIREEMGCPDSLGGGTKIAERYEVQRSIEKGELKGTARILVQVRSDYFHIDFQTTSAPSKIESTGSDTTSNMCNPADNGTIKSPSGSSPGRWGAGFRGQVARKGKFSPNDPSLLNDSETRSDGLGGTITITWNLTRCK
jgi:hypothetical protein